MSTRGLKFSIFWAFCSPGNNDHKMHTELLAQIQPLFITASLQPWLHRRQHLCKEDTAPGQGQWGDPRAEDGEDAKLRGSGQLLKNRRRTGGASPLAQSWTKLPLLRPRNPGQIPGNTREQGSAHRPNRLPKPQLHHRRVSGVSVGGRGCQ